MFRFKVAPCFLQCDQVVILFDDPQDDRYLDLKKTGSKRYVKQYPEIFFDSDTVIEDWEIVLRSPMNKMKYKKIFVDIVIQIADKYMKSGQALYLNGTLLVFV